MYIASAGIISSLGCGLSATEKALRENRSGITPLRVFPVLQGDPLPVGQVPDFKSDCSLPRTHQLAREAASIVMDGEKEPPDAIILGCTTGGILTTEQLLRDNVTDQEAFRHHGLLSVASDLAAIYGCPGPALMVSTACSSSAVAITLAMNLLRTGKMRRVLAGGVDSLSRLTYFGFHSLQLVDVKGCKPMDADRHGISVAEGAAMLLLTSSRPKSPLAVLLGAGLSCDAHHPTAPHPEGAGALRAMQNALADAGLQPSDIDYINLHGTGTPDNDLSESKAIRTLFPSPPPLSSIKGATGHSLAAAGAIGAVTAVLAASRGFIPGNVGCHHPDPALGLTPQADHRRPSCARRVIEFFRFRRKQRLACHRADRLGDNYRGGSPSRASPCRSRQCLSDRLRPNSRNVGTTRERLSRCRNNALRAARQVASLPARSTSKTPGPDVPVACNISMRCGRCVGKTIGRVPGDGLGSSFRNLRFSQPFDRIRRAISESHGLCRLRA